MKARLFFAAALLLSTSVAAPAQEATPHATVGESVFYHEGGHRGVPVFDCVATVLAVRGSRTDLECDGRFLSDIEELGFGGSPNAIPNYWAPLDDA